MGLRSFHLFFIAISVMLAAFFAAWCGDQYRMRQEALYAISAVLSLASAAGLAAYGVNFQRKTRQL
ncbi:MAG: hypothetical protein AB7O32_09940 [Vicinamibacterales bacterium]|jgi:ABC-type Mn2+/Zn2+ transport system permease subunit